MVVALAVPVTNTNPTVASAGDGKQVITVHDSDLGNRRTIVTTKEECDRYINEQKQLKEEASRKTAQTTLLSALGGTGLGALVGFFKGKSDTKAMDAVIDQCNALLRAGKSKNNVFLEHSSDFFRKFSTFLDDFYNKSTKEFNKVGNTRIKECITHAAPLGTILFGLAGLLVGLKHYEPVKASTQEFIKNNS